MLSLSLQYTAEEVRWWFCKHTVHRISANGPLPGPFLGVVPGIPG
jgi:hypothetical protein